MTCLVMPWPTKFGFTEIHIKHSCYLVTNITHILYIGTRVTIEVLVPMCISTEQCGHTMKYRPLRHNDTVPKHLMQAMSAARQDNRWFKFLSKSVKGAVQVITEKSNVT